MLRNFYFRESFWAANKGNKIERLAQSSITYMKDFDAHRVCESLKEAEHIIKVA